MALSWVIGTFPLPVFKFSTLQGESEHVLGAGRYRRQALIQGPTRPEKSWSGSTSKKVTEVRDRWVRGTPKEGGNTHDVGALGLEGIGTTDVQVGGIVWLKEADEVEALGLQRERYTS